MTYNLAYDHNNKSHLIDINHREKQPPQIHLNMRKNMESESSSRKLQEKGLGHILLKVYFVQEWIIHELSIIIFFSTFHQN